MGKTIVMSGVFDSLKRNEAEDMVKRHGGKVTSAVSGKTTLLLVGMSCGRRKIAQVCRRGRLFQYQNIRVLKLKGRERPQHTTRSSIRISG